MSLKFLIVLFIAVVFRLGAFFSPHNSWDQIYYSSLAMKLDTGGFKDYNLHDVAFRKMPGPEGTEIYKDFNPENTLLGRFDKQGFTYYDEPLFFEPPLLPYLLKFSHDIFAPHQKYVFIDANAWRRSQRESPMYFFRNSFYNSIVPFTFSVLSIVIIFLFCSKFINEEVAFYAGLMLAVSPVHVLTGTKIWTDSVGLFFYCATLFLCYTAFKKDNYFYAILTAILCSLAVMSRIANLNILFVLMFYRLYLYKDNFKKSLFGFVDKKIIIFIVLFLLLTSPWFLTVTRIFGTPLHLPYQKNFAELFPFVNFELHRPWFTYIVDIIFQNPIWILFFLFPFLPSEKEIKSLLVTWAIVPLLILTILPKIMQVPIHDIYALPVYPAMAIGTGYVLYKIKSTSALKSAFFNALILSSVLWSMFLSFKYAYILFADCINFPL